MARGRLSFGEYSTRTANQATARVLFLAALAELVPDVLATLRDSVLPLYVKTLDEVTTCADPDTNARRWERYQDEHAGRRVILCVKPYDVSRWPVVGSAHVSEDLAWYPDLLPLRDALEVWSQSYHLPREPWVLDPSLFQLDGWYEYPHLAVSDRLQWLGLTAAGPGSAMQQHEHRLIFEHAGWDPTWDTRSHAEAAIRADFEQRLREHLDAVETRVAAADGFEQAKEYRSLQQHVAWLVRYQVRRDPWPVVAETADRELANGRRVPVSADYVARAVKVAAALLGLTLDQVRRPGRPIGSKDSTPRHTV